MTVITVPRQLCSINAEPDSVGRTFRTICFSFHTTNNQTPNQFKNVLATMVTIILPFREYSTKTSTLHPVPLLLASPVKINELFLLDSPTVQQRSERKNNSKFMCIFLQHYNSGSGTRCTMLFIHHFRTRLTWNRKKFFFGLFPVCVVKRLQQDAGEWLEQY